MRIHKCFFDFKKEEQWLEEKAKQGYRFVRAGFLCYDFDYVNHPEEQNIKIDYRYFNKEEDFRNYITLFEDSGWYHIAGTKWSGSQYFMKLRPEAQDDIFSDHLSRAGRYKRFSLMWLSIFIAYIPLIIMYAQKGYISLDKFLQWKSFYLTPGLWEMKGHRFIMAFLFETPFALLRGFGWLFFVLIIIFYMYFSLQSYRLYRKELKKKI